MTETKTCRFCTETKEIGAFAKRLGKPLKTCITCNRANSLVAYHANKEVRQAYNRNYGKETIECECGSIYSKRCNRKHLRSNRHKGKGNTPPYNPPPAESQELQEIIPKVKYIMGDSSSRIKIVRVGGLFWLHSP